MPMISISWWYIKPNGFIPILGYRNAFYIAINKLAATKTTFIQIDYQIDMTGNIFFYLGLSLLIMHEMDAIRCKEWRIFPGLSMLSDKVGHIVFLFAHVPLFYFILWKLTYSDNIEAFIYGFNIFLIVHLSLHILFLKHKNNEFKDWISWIIIIGAGLCGLLGLLIWRKNIWDSKKRNKKAAAKNGNN